MLSIIIWLLSSSLFHLFLAKSEKFFKMLSKFDYAGISILITGSSIPPNIYGLYWEQSKIK